MPACCLHACLHACRHMHMHTCMHACMHVRPCPMSCEAPWACHGSWRGGSLPPFRSHRRGLVSLGAVQVSVVSALWAKSASSKKLRPELTNHRSRRVAHHPGPELRPARAAPSACGCALHGHSPGSCHRPLSSLVLLQ